MSAKRADWERRAAKKKAIVPEFFEVFPTKVTIVCGKCKSKFVRNLIPNMNDPTFICPIKACRARNWIPLTYRRS